MARTWGSDISWIHDTGFSSYSLNVAPGILALLREHATGEPGLVVDLGCGSGILARQLGFAGHSVLGVDQSEPMLKLARRNAPAARFVRADLLDAAIPKCSAVLCVGEALSFAASVPDGAARVEALLVRAREALEPGGFVLFDYAQTGRLPGGMPRHGHWMGAEWAVMVQVEPPEADPNLLIRRLTSFRMTVDGTYKRSEEIHRLRIFDGTGMEQMATRAGLQAATIQGIGSLRFRSGHGGILAWRAGRLS